MPTPYASSLLRFAFLLLLCLPAGPALYAQVTPNEGHLTAPQTPARAKRKITMYPGLSLPSGGSFEGEVVTGAVDPPEATTLTVSANVTIRAGEITPLTASAAPLVGNAISFDGTNDYVKIDPVTSLAFERAQNFTVEAWFRTTAAGSLTIFARMGNASPFRGYALYLSNGRLVGEINHTLPSSSLQVLTTGATFNDGKWHHAAWTYNGSSDPKGSLLYVDGELQLMTTGANTLPATTTPISESTVPAMIGSRNGGNLFNGQLDEVRVWTTARSPADISGNYGKTVDPASTRLAGYWRLDDELASAVAVDSRTTTPLHGTLFNLPRRVRSTVPFTSANPRVIQWVQSDAAGNPVAGAPITTGPRLEVSPTQTSYYRASSVRHDGIEEWAMVTVTVQPALGPLPQVRDNLNYIVEHTVLKQGQSAGTLSGLTAAELAEKITYFDGLGRPVQQVSTQASPGRKDLVQPIAYDAFGREDKKYLPYPHAEVGDGRYKPNAITEQKSRYDALKQENGSPEGPAVAETRFEASPLGRVLEQGAPGTDWQLTDRNPERGNANHSVKMTTRTNQAGEVRQWEYDFNTGQATGNGFYPVNSVVRDGVTYQEGQLLVSEVTDEQNHVTFEYKDKAGRVVCKKVQDGADNPETPEEEPITYATTYYVYDAFGLLRFVIPPQAVEELEAGTSLSVGFESNFAKRWLFAYRYDAKGRLSEKRVPGAEPVWLVYNGRDELILTQDKRQRAGYNSITAGEQLEPHLGGEWSFTKYDAFGRVVMSGLYRPGTAYATQAAMQAAVEAAEAGAASFEKRESGTGSLEGYSQQAYPRPEDGTLTPLSVSYYDDYSFPNASALAFVPLTGFAQRHLGDTKPGQLRGKPTAGKTRLLGSVEWLHSVVYYDEYNRTIQTITENHSKSGSERGRDIVWNNYDFAGKLLNSQTRHQNLEAIGAKTRIVKTRTTYDHAGRVTGSYQQVEEGTEERLAELSYNELGELDSKRLGKEGLQQVDYRYNIRGWLRKINQANLATPQDQPKDLFGLELSYNSSELYNGNIGSQSWMSSSDGVARSYVYGYDPINRLLRADYSAGGGLAGATPGAFSLSGMQYDKNGNILSLSRQGLQSVNAANKLKTFGLVDALTYDYGSGTGKSNQLLSVSDGQLDKSYLASDFKDGAGAALEYDYDEAGNLESDLNKGITGVLYNHLNLPVQVEMSTGRFIRYFYDAAGVKRRKVVHEGTASSAKVTDYMGGMVYEGNLLQFVPTAEGRALPPEQTGEAFFAYEYHYKDHLGNLRAAFRKAPTVPAFVATMEPASAPLEEAQFDNVARTRSSEHGLNPPVGPKHSARVGPLADGSRQVLGPWRTIAVKQGDRLQAQVFAYYTTASPNNESQRVRLTAFVNPQAAPPTGEQTQNLWDKLKLGLSFDLARPVDQQDNSVPVAYLKYIFYDKEYKPLKDDYIAVTSAALAANGGWEGLSFDITASEEGYVQVLVANESEKAVWFDDLEIKHSPALIVQENHYDPWGLNLAGIEKQGQPDHKFQYLNREKQEELGLGWLDLQARMYDPQLGRFHAVDPLPDTEGQESLTPYQYAWNNPVTKSDPDGRCPCLVAPALPYIAPTLIAIGEAIVASGALAVLTEMISNYRGPSIGGSPATSFALSTSTPQERAKLYGLNSDSKPNASNANASSSKSSSGEANAGSPPNPNGKKGSPKHQEKINEKEKEMQGRGLTTQREESVLTPDGEKSKRYVDLTGTDPKTGKKERVQVGKQNADGTPVSRERRAMDDIQNADGNRPTFVPYNDPKDKKPQ